MASGKVSKEYRWVLIREECDAFISKEEAVKQAREAVDGRTHITAFPIMSLRRSRTSNQKATWRRTRRSYRARADPTRLKCSDSRSIPRSATTHICIRSG